MNQEAVMKWIKAASGLLALIGITVSPEQANQISTGFLAVYSIITAIQANIKRKQSK